MFEIEPLVRLVLRDGVGMAAHGPASREGAVTAALPAR
jgi:hypothetical protein